MPRQQPDLFQSDDEPDLFGPGYAPPVFRPDPDRVRARLHKLLAEARAAEALPWDDEGVDYYRTLFPQMVRCLPPEEGEQLCLEFEAELERLKAA